jgi:tRNA threonylcarbamoyladenosine biosynthesis protein TsaE
VTPPLVSGRCTCKTRVKNWQDASGVNLIIDLNGLAATEALGRALAPRLRQGDTVALSGALGAGKTALARAIIATRLAALGRAEEVPSPSYTLVQTYDLGNVELWHVDLYRLGDPSELAELGLEDAFAAAIVLVEWPERLGALRPERVLDVALDLDPHREERRLVRLVPRGGDWEWLPGCLPMATAPAGP